MAKITCSTKTLAIQLATLPTGTLYKNGDGFYGIRTEQILGSKGYGFTGSKHPGELLVYPLAVGESITLTQE